MIRISPRLRHVSTATVILILAAAPALVERVAAAPVPLPKPVPCPLGVPCPQGPGPIGGASTAAPAVQPDASTPAADAAVSPRDPATGLPTGKRMHKPYTIAADPVPPPSPAGPQPTPYPNTGGTQQRIVTSADPMEGGQVTSVTSSDPQEGGEIAHKHIAGVKYEDFKAADVQLLEVQSVSWAALSSDPEEGGQVAARRLRPGRPTYGDARIVTKEPTSVEVPNLAAGGDAQPRVSGGTAKVSVLLKACATGTHYPAVKISMRSGGPSHTLRDVTVTACNANGDGETQTCTLSYASLDQ